MSLLPFLVVTFAGAIACLVLRARPDLEIPLGLAGLLAATIAAFAITPGDPLRLGSGEVLLATAYGRLFLLLGAALGLGLCLIGLATTWSANLPAALLVGLGGIGIGLSLADPPIAVLALLAAATTASLVGLTGSSRSAEIRAVLREVRLIVIAGVMAYLAIAWAAPALSGIGGDPAAFGLADLAIVVAVALRFGAIPFHQRVARLTDSAPGTALPLLLVWGPTALAVVALGVTDGSTMVLLVPSGIGQALVVAIAAATLVLGAVGAWLQDDLEHVVGYSIVQDAGFVLLGLAIGGSAAHEPARIWLLILVAAKTAFAAWVVVVQARFRTARLPELNGWARRSPLLAIALVGIVVGTLGVPGLLAWDTRAALIRNAAGGPLAVILLLAGLASLVYYGRIILVGLGRPSLLVDAAAVDRPVATGRGATPLETVRTGWLANRAPIAGGLVLVLVLISVILAAGGLGGPEAARAAGPQPSAAVVGP